MRCCWPACWQSHPAYCCNGSVATRMPPVLEILLACWFFAIGVQAIRKRDARLWKLLVVSVICVLGVGCVGVALKIAARHTAKYDLWLYAADRTLGSPAFAMARLLRPTAL